MLPAAGMQLVDVHGLVVALGAPLHPGMVVKGKVLQVCQLAGGAGAQLAGKGVGVAAHDHAAVCPVDTVLVQVTLLHPGNKSVPDAGRRALHRDTQPPAVKAAADLH